MLVLPGIALLWTRIATSTGFYDTLLTITIRTVRTPRNAAEDTGKAQSPVMAEANLAALAVFLGDRPSSHETRRARPAQDGR